MKSHHYLAIGVDESGELIDVPTYQHRGQVAILEDGHEVDTYPWIAGDESSFIEAWSHAADRLRYLKDVDDLWTNTDWWQEPDDLKWLEKSIRRKETQLKILSTRFSVPEQSLKLASIKRELEVQERALAALRKEEQ